MVRQTDSSLGRKTGRCRETGKCVNRQKKILRLRKDVCRGTERQTGEQRDTCLQGERDRRLRCRRSWTERQEEETDRRVNRYKEARVTKGLRDRQDSQKTDRKEGDRYDMRCKANQRDCWENYKDWETEAERQV